MIGLETLVEFYESARAFVISAGFGEEVEWQDSVFLSNLSESQFLREAAWVILSAGLNNRVVEKLFPVISRAFYWWESAARISTAGEQCVQDAREAFRHETKLRAIVDIAREVHASGFQNVIERVRTQGVHYIRQFPFMGPATAHHFAKNIGLPTSKPDRHLLRLAAALGYSRPEEMCRAISVASGDRVSVVDLVLWRYATLKTNYLEEVVGLYG